VNCCQCRGIESQFDGREAARKLARYRQHGPERSTRILLDALLAEGVAGLSLLDIGGGVGAIQHALLDAGASGAVDVDAAGAYLDAAREEGRRRGLGDRVRYVHGDFVERAAEIEPADIVTLDRVICCYPDMPALVSASAARARRLYGLVYPRDTWWVAAGTMVVNAAFWLQRTPFRVFKHPTAAMDALLRGHGLEQRLARDAGPWQVALYARPS
jgi:magnesium-protoporphyrin O-methyltransferase